MVDASSGGGDAADAQVILEDNVPQPTSTEAPSDEETAAARAAAIAEADRVVAACTVALGKNQAHLDQAQANLASAQAAREALN